MKSSFVKTTGPCNESWEQMSSDEKGKYCDKCSKTVIDFTQMNMIEIAEVMKQMNRRVCGRISQETLELPLPLSYDSKTWRPQFPKYIHNTGYIAATALTFLSSCNHIEISPTIKAKTELFYKFNKNDTTHLDDQNIFRDNCITVKGNVRTAEKRIPIEGITVSWVTSSAVFKAKTAIDGSFELRVPEQFVKDTNVIHVDYRFRKVIGDLSNNFYYKSQSYIILRSDLNVKMEVLAEKAPVYLGGLICIMNHEQPAVLINGNEISWDSLNNMRNNKELSNKLFNMSGYYFNAEIGKMIYGNKAKYGLYLYFNKENHE